MRIRAALWPAVLLVLSLVGVSHAQVDVAKALVGRWESEQETSPIERTIRSAPW
jgi:hypothetical protein